MNPAARALALDGTKALLSNLPSEVPEEAHKILGSAIGIALDALESGHPDPEAMVEVAREHNRTELFAAVSAALRAKFPGSG